MTNSRSMSLALVIALTLLLPSFCLAQGAKGLTTYRELIELATDGSARVTVDVTLAGWQQDRIDLPMNFATADGMTIEAPGLNASAATATVGDVRVLRVQFDRPPPTTEQLKITFTVKTFLDWTRAKSPRGTYALSYTFTNATSTTIGDYAVRIALPAGYTVTGVTSSTPRMTGEEVEPPYLFGTEGNQVVMTLRMKPVAPAKFAAIAFNFESAQRNPLPVLVLAALIALAGLYLKRDVLTSPTFERDVAG